MKYSYYTISLLVIFVLTGCSKIVIEEGDSAPDRKVDVSRVPDAVPKNEPRSRYGNPDSYEVFGKRYYVMNDSRGYVERGIASWYGTKFHGRRTSSGETYDMYAMTAAHKSLPLPCYVEVINLENNRRIVVKVNDRGPFHENRIIDLSYTAAMKLDIVAKGTGLVEVRAIDPGTYVAGKQQTPAASRVNYEVSNTNHATEFYIQVGAFSELFNARRLEQKISPLGASLINISEAVVNGQTVFRVRLGPFTDVIRSDNVVSRLAEYGLYDHHIVIE